MDKALTYDESINQLIEKSVKTAAWQKNFQERILGQGHMLQDTSSKFEELEDLVKWQKRLKKSLKKKD
jgi:hypothetical protein